MTLVAGIDVGSTYTKAVLIDHRREVLATAMQPTGFRLAEVADKTLAACLDEAKRERSELDYLVATGSGRHQVRGKDVHVTELTAAARGACHFFSDTRTVLDIGGQTMKASRLDEAARVLSFRLNDKCAAGTGAFLEKTARYMGYGTGEIGSLLVTSRSPVPISGVCAVFAESEVINHLSMGTPPAEILAGALDSLVGRAVQLLKRARAEPGYTLVGGILRFPSLASAVQAKLGAEVHVPEGANAQHVAALGAALLGLRRLASLRPGQAAVEARP